MYPVKDARTPLGSEDLVSCCRQLIRGGFRFPINLTVADKDCNIAPLSGSITEKQVGVSLDVISIGLLKVLISAAVDLFRNHWVQEVVDVGESIALNPRPGRLACLLLLVS